MDRYHKKDELNLWIAILNFKLPNGKRLLSTNQPIPLLMGGLFMVYYKARICANSIQQTSKKRIIGEMNFSLNFRCKYIENIDFRQF